MVSELCLTYTHRPTEVVEDARQNFAAASSTSLPPLPIAPVSRRSSSEIRPYRASRVPEYLAKPVVVADAQTAIDKSVLVLAPVLEENGEFVLYGVRFAAAKVPGAAMNIEISNQDIIDVSISCQPRSSLLISASIWTLRRTDSQV